MQDRAPQRDVEPARRDRRAATGWPAAMNRAVGTEVKRLRRARQWTQEELADRLREIGVDFSTSAVVNLEAHRRQGVALHELIALAAVLGTSPLALALPDRRAPVELLPDRRDPVARQVGASPQTTDATSAVTWFAGMYLPPAVMIDEGDPDGARARYEAANRGLDLLREHEAFARDLLAVAQLRGGDTTDLYRSRIAALRDLRAQIAHKGWPLPVLPWPLSEHDVDGPPSPVTTDDKEDGS